MSTTTNISSEFREKLSKSGVSCQQLAERLVRSGVVSKDQMQEFWKKLTDERRSVAAFAESPAPGTATPDAKKNPLIRFVQSRKRSRSSTGKPASCMMVIGRPLIGRRKSSDKTLPIVSPPTLAFSNMKA